MARPRMDCARFRARHLDYLDDALPAESKGACDRHRRSCAACAAFDVLVRRSLLLVRNLPPAPSACDVTERVLAALAADRGPRPAAPRLGAPLPAPAPVPVRSLHRAPARSAAR